MDSLIEIVSKTISNLQDKVSFLETQKQHYNDIKLHLADYCPEQAGDDETRQRGLVLGELIISSKIYLNIGYEYYVEKSQQEALRYVTDKLRLIDDAVLQFTAKNKEANETLKNLRQAQDLERNSESREDADPSIDPAENDEGLPFMEIREDLDDDGNVLSGSVKPTSGQNGAASESSQTASKIEEIKDDGEESSNKGFDRDFETNVRRNATSTLANSSSSQVVAGQQATDTSSVKQEETPYSPSVNSNQYAIDPNDMYTFDDIVEQLEQQDLLEDGDIDDEDVHYDFNSYNAEYHDDDDAENESQYDDSDDYEDYPESSIPSIIPDVARSRFMEQINALRSSKINGTAQNATATTTKPILKKDKKAGEPKKRVGFAPELDVFEVENVKHETKANTFTGRAPMASFAAVSSVDEEGFDPDLFAQLIGAKNSEEVHDKFQSEVQDDPPKRKARISRFKKDMSSTRSTSAVTEKLQDDKPWHSDIKEKNTGVMADVQEKNAVIDAIVPEIKKNGNGSKKVDGSQKANLGDSSDISAVSEKLSATHIQDSQEASKHKSLFKKNLRSLSKPPSKAPRKNTSVLAKITEKQEMEPENPLVLRKADEMPIFDNADAKPFPEEVAAIVNQDTQQVVQNPRFDYQGLGENLDGMARAYLLGLYNDDVEDAGTVVERLDDFKNYNKEAESLKGEIASFLAQNPAPAFPTDERERETEGGDDSSNDQDGPVTTDVVEKEVSLPPDYDADDIALSGENLHYEVAVEYQRLRQKMIASQGNVERAPEELQREPIDEHGNPVKTSRFKAAKLRFQTQ
ncbi:LAME_0A02828g1_1 [Lachancea meyersii CBS 8951]|uniref:LAME_0A02828g1_1 n=1 Tax=Lachancea meyersii CBS 8951 TaxID=1266667 RepID=A0A1G4IMS8_9SACH|nr:LAME_0A02828g1_1 [Lachancea meyersii CBS 8951]